MSSSPEILCRVDEKRVVTNRPLAGTRRRGETPEADVALEKELLADAKEVGILYGCVERHSLCTWLISYEGLPLMPISCITPDYQSFSCLQ